MADLLWPPECHPGTRSVPLPLWLGTHSFFDEKTNNFCCSFQFWSTRREFYISVCILSRSFSRLLPCNLFGTTENFKKHRFVWNFVQNETAFCNLGSDLSWWSVRRWTWCVRRTILDPATCQPSNLGKVKTLSRSIKVLRSSQKEIYEARKMVRAIKRIGVEPATLSAP